jgi:hypothetical protein
MAAPCGGCHYGQLGEDATTPPPNVTVVAASSRVEPGVRVEITVSVEATWPEARVAGFAIIADDGGGVFTPSEEGTGNIGIVESEVLEYAIGHTQARELDNGSAVFRTTWTAPTQSGTYTFDVFGVTSNDGDGMDDPDVAEEQDDSFNEASLTLGVGCDLIPYFLDGDLDGYGGLERLACEELPGHVLQGGDCADDNPEVNPGATELCSFTDENCDGESMAPIAVYRDTDGDGYGTAVDLLVEECSPPHGYVTEIGDCAPDDPTIHPGAIELPDNGIDENCNGVTDEPAEGAPAVADGPEPWEGDPTAVPTAAPAPVPGASASGGQFPALAGTAPAPTTYPGESTPLPTTTGGGESTGCGVAVAPRTDSRLAVMLLLLYGRLLRRRGPPS